MDITCVIATRNPAVCTQLIAQLQKYQHHIVVVHPAGTDAPLGVTSITTPTLYSPAHARNLGAHASTSDLLCFFDDDISITTNIPYILAYALCAPHIVACGAIIYDHPENDYWQCAFHRMALADQHIKSAQRIPTLLSSMALLVRRSAFDAVGGFDETYHSAAGEDADFSVKLRRYGALFTLPQAHIHHHPSPRNWYGVTQRCWRYGVVWPYVRTRNMLPPSLPLPALVTAFFAPLMAGYDIARSRRRGYLFGRWWLRTCWYLGVAWGQVS